MLRLAGRKLIRLGNGFSGFFIFYSRSVFRYFHPITLILGAVVAVAVFLYTRQTSSNANLYNQSIHHDIVERACYLVSYEYYPSAHNLPQVKIIHSVEYTASIYYDNSCYYEAVLNTLYHKSQNPS